MGLKSDPKTARKNPEFIEMAPRLERDSKKGACPKCEDHLLKPEPRVLASCKFTAHGCKVKQEVGAIGYHEEQCQYREVHCPAKHRVAIQ